ncbi:alpha-D-ribose 1-methylphosphonate 5-triphosphate diphosphatase [Hoeflea poritis]|uniref:Alpha-D-ribose 1-methylphosphonate 5-triphosphate diphosphatase n=1 Tax=Hoeflea poritis TaxID=2993659 RepID=A0ABT4VQ45_9HYPH|nr:alpha-D-ribose 1-methylphosphonate 5-triphosphate diphosphatase [Hoeflea poritis]MDA4846831.1 alpha-D-ribose 1-methylphosphonate 5-triphosphate diphosphatase [Hoeflea poritis]
MSDFSIVNGQVLLPAGFEEVPIRISDGLLAGIDEAAGNVIDARGAYVLPGIVDVHGDAFERNLMPRPKVHFPPEIALHETDRQLVSNGITTAYHGLTVSWEPGLRSFGHTREMCEAIARNRKTLSCDTLVHLRWETFALDDAEGVLEILEDQPHAILAFNDHTTKSALGKEKPHKFAQMAQRAGLPLDEFRALVERVWARRADVEPMIARMARRAREVGATLLAHDEASVEQRRWFRNLGALASEFPLTPETAADARAHGEHVVLGAPNVVRGGSHNGATDATAAISEGLCSVLATDYYYPAPLLAAFKLTREGVCDLANAWELISKNPAEVAGLSGRGTIEPGKRADLILVDATDMHHPQVKATFVAGKKVFDRI